MANEQTPDHGVDGGAPTDEEARLAAQVDTIGDNPQSEPDDAGAAAAPAPADDAAAADAPAADDGAAAGADDGADDGAAAPAPAAAPAADAPPASPPAPPAAAPPPRPEPPKDFAAELATLQKQYDEGDLEGEDFQTKQRELIREEARYEARVALYDERMQEASQNAEKAWNTAAVSWENANADFMANPLRASAMQSALAMIEQSTPGLPPEKLFEEAQKVAFEAYNWAPAAAAANAGADGSQAIADALKARQGKPAPQTLASAPAAAQIETRGNAAFAELDGKDISSLEDTLARMTPQQQEAYLRDAPGANTNDPSPRDRRDQ